MGRHIGDRTHPVLIRLLASTSAAGSAGAPVDVPGLGITADSVSALDELVGTDGAIYDVFAGVIRYLGEHGVRHTRRRFRRRRIHRHEPPRTGQGVPRTEQRVRVPVPGRPGRATGPRRHGDAPALDLARERAAPGADRACPKTCRWRSTFRPFAWARRTYPDTGSRESRDPATGAFAPTGTFRRGVRRSSTDDRPGESLDTLPGGRDVLTSALRTLELHLRGAAQVEFEIRDGELSLLAARKVERPAPRTAVRLAVELAEARRSSTTSRRCGRSARRTWRACCTRSCS